MPAGDAAAVAEGCCYGRANRQRGAQINPAASLVTWPPARRRTPRRPDGSIDIAAVGNGPTSEDIGTGAALNRSAWGIGDAATLRKLDGGEVAPDDAAEIRRRRWLLVMKTPGEELQLNRSNRFRDGAVIAEIHARAAVRPARCSAIGDCSCRLVLNIDADTAPEMEARPCYDYAIKAEEDSAIGPRDVARVRKRSVRCPQKGAELVAAQSPSSDGGTAVASHIRWRRRPGPLRRPALITVRAMLCRRWRAGAEITRTRRLKAAAAVISIRDSAS